MIEPHQVPKFDSGIMVACGISASGLSKLILVEGSINGAYYREKIVSSFVNAFKSRSVFPKADALYFHRMGQRRTQQIYQ